MYSLKIEVMNEKEALEIISKENLSINWFGEHAQKPFEMVIRLSEAGGYQVYGTDERANLWGVIKEFTSLEYTLDNLIYKARF